MYFKNEATVYIRTFVKIKTERSLGAPKNVSYHVGRGS